MKIKDLISFSFYQRNVTSDIVEELPNSPLVTIKNFETKTVHYKAEDLVSILVMQAIIILKLQVEDAIDEDLIFRKMRQLTKDYFKLQKKRLAGDDHQGPFPKQLNNEDLADAFKVHLHNAKLYKIEKAQNYLSFRGTGLNEILDLINAWTGVRNALSAAVLKHFVWQAKRKLFGLPVKNHIMPILYGPQSGGKTEAIRKLISPFYDLGLVIYSNISQLTDERYLKVLSEYYICFSDEMGHAEKSDINSLKNIITAERLNPRILGKNTSFDIRQKCTFIGATNRPVNEMIFDPTGMRRFAEIGCLPKMDWDAINSFDYVDFVRSIDENNEDGYLSGVVLQDLRKEQEKIISYDDIHYFLEDSGYIKSLSRDGNFISNEEIYSRYTSWSEVNGTKFKHSKHEFLKRLKNRGFLDGSKNLSGKTYRGIWLLDQKALQLVGAK